MSPASGFKSTPARVLLLLLLLNFQVMCDLQLRKCVCVGHFWPSHVEMMSLVHCNPDPLHPRARPALQFCRLCKLLQARPGGECMAIPRVGSAQTVGRTAGIAQALYRSQSPSLQTCLKPSGASRATTIHDRFSKSRRDLLSSGVWRGCHVVPSYAHAKLLPRFLTCSGELSFLLYPAPILFCHSAFSTTWLGHALVGGVDKVLPSAHGPAACTVDHPGSHPHFVSPFLSPATRGLTRWPKHAPCTSVAWHCVLTVGRSASR